MLPMLDNQGVVSHGSLATFILVCEDHADSFCKQIHVGLFTYVYIYMYICIYIICMYMKMCILEYSESVRIV